MANEQNLKPCEYKLSREEAKKGGINSGITRRRKKTLKEIIEMFGALNVTSEKIINRMKSMGIEDAEEMTNDLAMIIGQYTSAQRGNTNAANFIRDTKGEKPKDVVENHNIEYKPLVDFTKRKKNGE